MNKSRRLGAIVVVGFLVSLTGYTLTMLSTEPHPFSPTTITSKDYANSLTQTAGGNPNSLFFHTFTLNDYNATFGISLISHGNPTLFYKQGKYQSGIQTFEILFTEVNKSRGFPYFGELLVEPITVNVSITVMDQTYYSHNPYNQTRSSIFASGGNSSLVGCFYIYYSPVTFTTDPNVSNGNIPYVSSYNLTYSIEIRPIVEWGPYYTEGNTILLNHTFEYTLAISKSV